MAGAPKHEGCTGRLVSKVETEYGETIEPDGVLVCNACLMAVDPSEVSEESDPVAEGEEERAEGLEPESGPDGKFLG